MAYRHTEGTFLTPNGWLRGVCEHQQAIAALHPASVDAASPIFLPAPIDLHVHGGGGFDVMQGDDAIRGVLRASLRTGTGALLATSVTAPFAETTEFLGSVQRLMQSPPADGSVLLGAHLEGPFINPEKLGAQPPFAEPLDLAVLESWLQTGVVRLVTYAPETDQHSLVPPLCRQYGVKCQLGHSLCSWQQAKQAIELGAGVTHLYNAMSGMTHRHGGLVSAALAYADYAEIITDGVHSDRAAFDLAYRCIPKLYSVTDATAAAGMPDGHFQLGNLRVSKHGDRVQLDDGTLAGSCLTQIRSFELLRQWGLDWPAIARLCAIHPACWLNQPSLATIAVGSAVRWIEISSESVAALWINELRIQVNTSNERHQY